jgi:RPC5 protein
MKVNVCHLFEIFQPPSNCQTLSNSASVKSNSEEVNGSKIISDPNDPDPVIHEIPVFLAKELAQKLFLFQASQILLSLSNSFQRSYQVYDEIPIF